jgi:hypothetical protein
VANEQHVLFYYLFEKQDRKGASGYLISVILNICIFYHGWSNVWYKACKLDKPGK